jgi:hypothetical protein
MYTNQTQQPAVSSNVSPVTGKSIMARVVLQAWGGPKGKDAVLVEEKEVDVTHAILLLAHDFVIQLQDAFDQTDEIGMAHVDHSGPLEVYVTESICQFFGVEELGDITPAAFDEARRTVRPMFPEEVRAIIEIEVTATVLRGAVPVLDNLEITARSNTDNLIVTSVTRRKPSVGHNVELATPNPALPHFMQLLALATAIRIDGGSVLTDWTAAPWAGVPTNEVVRFVWTDGDFNYSDVLTEEIITSGVIDAKGKFVGVNQEGDVIAIQFYLLQALTLKDAHNVH